MQVLEPANKHFAIVKNSSDFLYFFGIRSRFSSSQRQSRRPGSGITTLGYGRAGKVGSFIQFLSYYQ